MKKCFVISPIGADGTATREHANDVFDYIIKPAMEECGIAAYRSDHLHEPGKISEQMFRAILQDDLAVAVLTGYNPNVFYELAVAQCAGRPTIILLEKGQTLPFDLKDLRCVYYDLKPRTLFERAHARELVAHVKSIEAGGWKATSPVSGLDLFGEGTGAGAARFYKRTIDFGNPESWLKLLTDTERVFEVMGLTLGSWKRAKGFSEALAAKARAGCRVRLLLSHPENPSLRESINPHIPEEDFDSTVNKIDEMLEYLQAIARTSPNVEIRQVRRGCQHFHVTRTDQVALVIQYLYSESARFSPLWQYSNGSPLYAIMAQEFDALWRRNEGPSSDGPTST